MAMSAPSRQKSALSTEGAIRTVMDRGRTAKRSVSAVSAGGRPSLRTRSTALPARTFRPAAGVVPSTVPGGCRRRAKQHRTHGQPGVFDGLRAPRPSSRWTTSGTIGASGSFASATTVGDALRPLVSIGAVGRAPLRPSDRRPVARWRRLSSMSCSESGCPGRPGSSLFTPATPPAAPMANPGHDGDGHAHQPRASGGRACARIPRWPSRRPGAGARRTRRRCRGCCGSTRSRPRSSTRAGTAPVGGRLERELGMRSEERVDHRRRSPRARGSRCCRSSNPPASRRPPRRAEWRAAQPPSTAKSDTRSRQRASGCRRNVPVPVHGTSTQHDIHRRDGGRAGIGDDGEQVARVEAAEAQQHALDARTGCGRRRRPVPRAVTARAPCCRGPRTGRPRRRPAGISAYCVTSVAAGSCTYSSPCLNAPKFGERDAGAESNRIGHAAARRRSPRPRLRASRRAARARRRTGAR